jgi:ATP-dependent DNA helicase RecG
MASIQGEVTGEVAAFLSVLVNAPLSRSEEQGMLNLKSQANFRERYLDPALA